ETTWSSTLTRIMSSRRMRASAGGRDPTAFGASIRHAPTGARSADQRRERRRELARSVDHGEGAVEAAAAREAARCDEAAQAGRSRRGEAALGVLDGDARLGAKPRALERGEVRRGIGLRALGVAVRQHEVEVAQEARAAVDQLEVLGVRTRDDAHRDAPVQRREHLLDALERGDAGGEALGVERVARGPQRLDLARVDRAAHQLEDAAPAAQREVDEALGGSATPTCASTARVASK